ncbi:bile acid:sodium symporter family protein [Blastomonas sp. CCH5-A3]|jgi:sodium/bile acid cotransporter 7|uniref:bile acid:sodium symporter family protein n=1 Tax=Blastomonas sp. CCH5-A3 TaxID=1768761 RepID=UPI0008264C34|nr:bile acid:sodium symporter family protein [Blastomonas sp. CCH5-A3]MAF61076.1 bile acid:sodium symporter [Blastomonas sp.]|tara:strand:- start:60128 stop:61099 length:972 start_codon:yes stop_codon:yes gene_type:complete
MSILTRFIPDRFVLMLLLTVAVAAVLPVTGQAAVYAGYGVSVAIFLLFFLHGLRLPRAEVIVAMKNWRLQGLIFAFTFAFMPLLGLAASQAPAGLLPHGLVIGLLFLGILPSTVQSAISYSSLAGGNIAASVMASALLNLAGIIMTPLLVALLIGADGGASISSDTVIKILSILLLPFALGQIVQAWLGAWAQRNKSLLTLLDRSSIAIAVYVAFSSAVAGGKMQTLGWSVLAMLCAIILLMLVLSMLAAWGLGGLLGLPRADRISLLFAGSHKSIATGAPLAAILFAGPQAGIVILPALIYHQLQLVLSAPLASRLAKHDEA